MANPGVKICPPATVKLRARARATNSRSSTVVGKFEDAI